MEIHLKIIGVLLIFLAFVHITFPKKFAWKTDLQSLNLMNKQLIMVHTFFIALTTLLMGLLCLLCADDLVNTSLGHHISFYLFLFWGIRLLFQFFVYSSKLWKGKPFETIVHVGFSFVWVYFTLVFFFVSTVI